MSVNLLHEELLRVAVVSLDQSKIMYILMPPVFMSQYLGDDGNQYAYTPHSLSLYASIEC